MGRLNEGSPSFSGGGDAPMKPGETKVIHVKDKATGAITKTITLHRTTRPYVEDLCDAYNDAMSESARQRGLLWYVANGELKLGDHLDFNRWKTGQIEAQTERERQDWKRAQSRLPASPSQTDESREPEMQD